MQDDLTQLWLEYHVKLHDFIECRVSDPMLADDILQDVFLKIHANIEHLKSKEKIRAWIYKIAANAIIDHYRTHKPVAELPETLSAFEDDSCEEERNEIMTGLRSIINSLPPHYAAAVMMSEFEGLTQQEIASRLGLSLSGAKSRVQRGRSLLKERLLECCRFEFDKRGRPIDYERKKEVLCCKK